MYVHWPPLYRHRSFSPASFPLRSLPPPPKIQKSPAESTQAEAPRRADGTLAGSGTPMVPNVPRSPTTFDPDIQVHSPPLYLQRSLRIPKVPAESTPLPPNSQNAPEASVHVAPSARAPGMFAAAGVPRVP